MNEEPIKKSWEEFRLSGMLWFINRIIHIFGWAIVISYDENENVVGAYPARVSYRGFDEKTEDQNFFRITKHINDIAPDLLGDVNDPGLIEE